MSKYSVRQHQQSEIFFILFLLLMLVVIILKAESERTHKQPPIITLPEASGYKFVSGSAKLDENFQKKLLNEIIPQLQKIADEFSVNVIEVIGHTDDQIVLNDKGNLDTELESVAHSMDAEDIEKLVPSSNADLGLMRALSVIKFIQNHQSNNMLRGIKFRPYSAAQLLLPTGQIAPIPDKRNANKVRRRIELRFTRDNLLIF